MMTTALEGLPNILFLCSNPARFKLC